MTSAFGIDHGDIDKALIKLPKANKTKSIFANTEKDRAVFPLSRRKGVSKSFVSGQYVAATKLTPGARGLLKNRLKPNPKAWGPKQEKPPKGDARGRQIYDEQETRSMSRKISTTTLQDSPHKNLKPLGHTLLGSSQPNGKGGGVLRMNTHGPDQAATYRHELAHLAPKRNPVRFFERTNASEKTLGREEGRADFIGNLGRKTPGSYPGGPGFQRGYNQTQRKMAEGRARNRKPRTFAVDRKGEAVQKSAFGVEHVSKVSVSPKLGKYHLIRTNNADHLDGGEVPRAYKKMTSHAKETGAEKYRRDQNSWLGDRNKMAWRDGPVR